MNTKRRLVITPIAHTYADMGDISEIVRAALPEVLQRFYGLGEERR